MDIAQLGFRVDTGDLDKATGKLSALKTASAGVTSATQKVASAVEGSNAKVLAAITARAAADKAAADAALRTIRNTKEASKEDLIAAKNLQKKTAETLAHAIAAERDAKAIRLATAAQKDQKIAFASSSVSMGGTRPTGPSLAVNNGPSAPPIPRDMMPNRFNTANIAAQFQDIGVTASMGMNPMIIALQQGTQLSAILNSMQNPLKGIAQAFSAVINPVSLLSIGLVAVVAAGIQVVDWAQVARSGINLLANAVEYLLPAILGLSAGLLVLNFSSVVSGLGAVLAAVGSLTVAAGAATASFIAMAAAFLLTPIGLLTAGVAALAAGLAYVSGLFGEAGDAVRGWAKDLTSANEVANSLSQTINDQTIDLHNQITAMKLHGKERIAFIKEQELMNKAIKEYKGDDLVGYINSIEGSIKSAAQGYANMRTELDRLEESERKKKSGASGKTAEAKDPYADVVNGAKRRIETLKTEQAALGMTEQAAARLRYETELLNQANQKGIELTPKQREELKKYADEMAGLEEQTRRTKAAYDFVKDAARGFFQDLKSGLQEGKSLWESFGNAVTNVLNKILDKMLDSGINMVFDGLFGGGGAGGGAGSSILADIGSFLFAANGQAFGTNGMIPFAKGGAFTNSIVNRPTPFAFANGGKFGVMGEAGAEAVMPLHRGPDGSLGVRMNGGGAGNDNNVIVNINNYGDAKVSTKSRQSSNGLELDVMIDEIISQKVSDQASATNRSLNARDGRRLIAR